MQLFELLEQRLLFAGDGLTNHAPSSSIESLVNSLVPRLQASEQQSTAIEVAPNGDTLVVYSGRGLTDNDGIYLRRTFADGTSGPDQQINLTINEAQQRPQLAVYDNGSYVVAWDGRGPGDQQGIFARWYDAQDRPLTGETLINQITPGAQQEPDVAVSSDGTTIFVWSGTSGAADPEGVYRRSFDSLGQATSDQFRVNLATAGTQGLPSVAVSPAGQSVVTFSSRNPVNQQWQVLYQTFAAGDDQRITDADPANNPQREDRLASASLTASQLHSRVGIDAQGRFAIAWSGYASHEDLWNIYLRSFDAAGQPQTPLDTLVNSQQGGVQRDPDLAMADDGRFIISWTSGIANGSGWEVFAKLYNAAGSVAESDYLVHETSGDNSGHQAYSAVAIGRGPAQVAWSGTGISDRKGVWVRRSQQAASPTLQAIAPQTTDEQTTLRLQIEATPSFSEQIIRYDLEPFSHPIGLVIDPASGMLVWTPSEIQGPGEFTAVVIASDADQPELQDRQLVRIAVREVNLAPSLSIITPVTVDENALVRIVPQATDEDWPANQLTYSLLNSPNPNIQVDPRTGVIQWQTTESDGPGTYRFSLQVRDDGVPSKSAQQLVEIFVREDNLPPLVQAVSDIAIPEEITWSLQISATDPDRDPHDTQNSLTYSLDAASLARGLAINSQGTLSWQPTETQGPAKYPTSVTVSDTAGAQTTISFSIDVLEINRPPVLRELDNISLQTGQTLTETAVADDPDWPLNQLRYGLDDGSVQLGATIDATSGVLTWTPNTSGIFHIRVTVTDNGVPPLSDTRSMTVTVDSPLLPPTLQSIPDNIIDELTQLRFNLSAVAANPGQQVRYALGSDAPSGLTIDAITGSVLWMPSEAQGPATYDVTFIAFDPTFPALRDEARGKITVREVNLSPVLQPVSDRSINEGDLLSIPLSASDVDLPPNLLRYEWTPGFDIPAEMQLDQSSGLITWQSQEISGPDEWLIGVTTWDNGVPPLSDQTTFSITVLELNQPPVLALIPDQATDEMVPYHYQLSATDADIPVNTIRYRVDSASAALGIAVDAQGLITWTPTESQGPASYPITISVSDDNFSHSIVSQNFNLTVREVNRKPNLQSLPSFSIRPGEAVQFTASAADPDLPNNNLSFSLRGDVPPGASIDPISGHFQWSSTPSFDPKLFHFFVRTTDSGTPSLFDEQPVSIEVLPENVVLVEEERFVTAYEQRVQILPHTTAIRFTFDSLYFDTADLESMNDSFEASLVDSSGKPLAAIIAPNRDAFFNHTENEIVLLGAGTVVSRDGDRITLTVDVAHLPAGTDARLIQRLVNNDDDTTTQVTIYPGVEQLSTNRLSPASLITPAPFAPDLSQAVAIQDDLQWRHLAEVTDAVQIQYDHTVFDTDTHQIAAGLTLTNTSRYPLRSPLLLAISDISLPEVSLALASGAIPLDAARLSNQIPAKLRGLPYLNLSDSLIDEDLSPGESIRILVSYENPTNTRFDYSLHLVAALNRAPKFISTPPLTVRVGNSYRYASLAEDPDVDPLVYSLAAGPAAMTMDPKTGVLQWIPTSMDIGSHSVEIRATDPYGLVATQTFTLEIRDANTSNSPPYFVSDPVVDAYVGLPYLYQALAFDPDFDPLIYRIETGPSDLGIPQSQRTPRTSPVDLQWIPTADYAGQTIPVSVRASDPFGGEAIQTYSIRVHANPTNQPPVIVSDPQLTYRIPHFDNLSSEGDVAPTSIQQLLSPNQTITVPVAVTLPPDVYNTTTDVVLVVDESGSMQEQGWIAEMIQSLDAALIDQGLIDNRFAIVGYGSFDPDPRVVTEQPDYEIIAYGPSGIAVDRLLVRAGEPIPPLAFSQSGVYSIAVTRYLPDSNQPIEASTNPLEPLHFQLTANINDPLPVQRQGWTTYQAQLGPLGYTIPFTANAGDKLLIDAWEGSDVQATLVDPQGKSLFADRWLLDDTLPLRLDLAGEYQLVLTGLEASPFSLRFLDPVADAIPLQVDLATTGSLTDPDLMALYRFDSLMGESWIIDRLSEITSLSESYDLRLLGPDGVLSESVLSQSLVNNSLPIAPYDLSTGGRVADGATYTVMLSRSNLAPSSVAAIPYQFRLDHLSNNFPILQPETSHPVAMPSPQDSVHLSISLEREDYLSIDISQFSGDSLTWQLTDSNGLIERQGITSSGQILSDLPVFSTGIYTLSFHGQAQNVTASQFHVLTHVTQQTLPPISGGEVSLNQPVAGNFGAELIARYRLPLSQGDRFVPTLVSPSNGAVQWRMLAPSGATVFNHVTDASLAPNPGTSDRLSQSPTQYYAWETGDYVIEIVDKGFAAPFTFQIAGQPELLEMDLRQIGRVNPSGGVLLYTFVATQGQQLHLQSLQPDELFASADVASQRAQLLRAQGDVEDGYWGIEYAISTLAFRPNASRQVILLTDEDRDVLQYELSSAGLLQLIETNEVVLHNIASIQYQDSNDPTLVTAMGVQALAEDISDEFSLFYAAPNGAFDFSFTDAFSTAGGFGNTRRDYVDLAIAAQGTSWDIEFLRGTSTNGVNNRISFTNAFVSTLVDSITRQAVVQLVAVPSEAPVTIGTPQQIGSQIVFPVTFVGDGDAWNFDLEFVDRLRDDVLYGRIPVQIAAPYIYPVRAIDPENDPIDYALTAESNVDYAFDSQSTQFTFAPTIPGSYTFTATATDLYGGRDNQTWTVVVSSSVNSNQSPILSAIPDLRQEISRPISVDFHAEDPDGDALIYRLAPSPTSGALPPLGLSLDPFTGHLDWTPLRSQVGQYTIAIRVSDGRGGTDLLEWTIDVTPPVPHQNSEPSIVSAPLTVAVTSVPYRYPVLANDDDHDLLEYELILGPTGMVMDRQTGVLGWTPLRKDVGQHSVIVRVTDQQGGLDLQHYSLYVFEENASPVISSEPRLLTSPGDNWIYQVSAIDPNGDQIYYSLGDSTTALNVNIDHSSGRIAWQPNRIGSFNFEVIADDFRGGETVQQFLIDVREQSPPYFQTLPADVAIVGQPIHELVVLGDANASDTLSLALNSDSELLGATIVSTICPDEFSACKAAYYLDWMPSSSRTFDYQFVALDSSGNSTEIALTLDVTSPRSKSYAPLFQSTPTGPAFANQPWTYQVNAWDPDGGSVVYSLGPQSPSQASIDTQSGLLTFTATPATISMTIDVIATDSAGTSSRQISQLNIETDSSNNAPQFISLPILLAHQDSLWTYDAHAIDREGDSVRYSLNSSALNAGATIESTSGRIAFTPSNNSPLSITITAVDQRGLSSNQTFVLPILAPTNLPPRIVSIPTGPAIVGTRWSYRMEAFDDDGDVLSYSLGEETDNQALTIDSRTGVVSYLPLLPETKMLSFVVTDSKGGESRQHFTLAAVLPDSDTANQAPDFLSSPIGPAYLQQEWVYRANAMDSENDPIRYLLDNTSKARGMIIDDVTGRLSWVPTQVGQFPVVITAIDSRGATSLQSFELATVMFNRAPVIRSQPTGPIELGIPWQYQVVSNDPDSDTLTYSVDATALANGASISPQGLLSWTATDLTPISMTVFVSDPHGASSTQTIALIPQPARHHAAQPPRFLSLPTTQLSLGQSLLYTAIAFDPDSVLPNDTPIVYSLLSGPPGSTLNPITGKVSWRPQQLGTVSFVVLATDNDADSTQQSFSVEVVPGSIVNQPPRFLTDTLGPAVRDRTFEFQLLVEDEALGSLHFQLDAASEAIGINLDNQGKLKWLPTSSGHNSITVTVTDDLGAATTQTFVLIVLQNAPPHLFANAPLRGPQGNEFTIEFDAYEANADDQLTYSIANGPSSATIDPDTGTLHWVADVPGRFAIEVAVADDKGAYDSVIQWITVFDPNSNQAPQIVGNPRTKLRFDQLYIWQVPAIDPDQDPLTYELISGPVGLTLASHGLLQWTPETSQVTGETPHVVHIRVLDDRGGTTDQQWLIHVRHTALNESPTITGTPSLQTVAGRTYHANLLADDPDEDTIFWSLLESPSSLVLDSVGNIFWSPTLDDIGLHTIGVRASDPYGAHDEYYFDLVVRGTNSPARIEGNPPSLHRVQTILTVPFYAFDPDQDEVRFRFAPGSDSHGAMLNEQTGELRWTPSATGHFSFRITAVDPFGEGSTLVFDIEVDPFGPNQPPEFLSTDPGIAEAGLTYSHTFLAIDPEGLDLQYRVESGPQGMTIDQQGLLRWTPASELVGQSFWITLSASDPAGKVARYRMTLPVREPNQAPSFTSTPSTQITAGQTLVYELTGSDANSDPLVFDFISGPSGVTFDRDNARLTWQSTIDDIGSHEVVVSLTDRRISSPILQNWSLEVVADQQSPTVTVNADSTNVIIGQRVVYLVTANDNVHVEQRTLSVDGHPLSLDAHGYGITDFSTPGRYLAIATATDSAGNTSFAQQEIVVRNPNDSAPQLQIVYPTSSTRVTELIDIRLQLQDEENELLAIRAFIEPLDGHTNGRLLFERRAIAGEYLPQMFDEIVGQLDPTSFRNGSYRITIEAEDSSSNIATASTIVNIEGLLKLGTYTTGVVDLAIPLPGIPLVIQRVYNSLDADLVGDFGRGWTLDYGLASIQVDLETLGGLGSGRYAAFVDGTRIQISFPDGQSEGFTFQAIPGRRVGGTVIDYRPSFVSDSGIRSILHGPDQTLIRLGSSYVTDEGITYNPFDPAIGNFFQHVTSDGTVRTIRASSNTLLSIADKNGNEIAFEAGQLVSNRDKSIVIERDFRDRIAAITDPRGNKITYQYDAMDRLIAVTDREQNLLPENQRRSTTYTYDDDQPFLLVQAIDANGVVLFKNDIDATGKLVGQFNAFEGGVTSSFNTIDREQSVQINGTTISTTYFDSEGRLQKIDDYSDSNLLFEFSDSGKPRSLTRNLFDSQSANATEQLQFTLQLDDAGRVLSRTAPNGNTSFYTYDPYTGQVASEVDPLGNRTQYQYDEKGNLVATTDSKNQMVQYDFDEMGNTIGAYAIDLTDGSNDGCQSTTNFQAFCPATTTLFTATFDETGKQSSTTDGSGNVTVFHYDANNLVVRTETIAAIDPTVILVESTTLSANDFPTMAQTFRQLPSGSITSLNQSERQFDGSGRVLSERTPTGQRAAVEYDAAGRPVITRSIDLNSEVLVSYQIFDDQDRPSIQTNPVPEGQTPVSGKRFHYDLSSQIIRTDTLLGLSINITEFTGKPNIELVQLGQIFAGATVDPDGLNHPLLIETEDGRSVERTRNHEGHTIESRTTVRNANGGFVTRISRTVYDRYDRVLTATDPYDEFSNAPITGITNVYSASGDILRSDQLTDLKIDIVQLADGTFQSIVTNPGRLLENDRLRFDDAGRLLFREEPDGSRTEYHYDGQGRPIEILNVPSNISEDTYVSRTYYAEDDSFVIQIQRVPQNQASEPTKATRIFRDAAGRTIRTEFLHDIRTEIFTDIGGRYRIELVDSGVVDSWSTTTFDITGRPTIEINDLGGRTDYSYDELGNTTSVTGPSYYEIDLVAYVRPRTEHLFEGSRLLATKSGIRVLADGTIDEGAMRLTQFVYNDRGEVTATVLPNGQTVYATNNQAGQRTSETDMAGRTTQYEYSATGALSAIIQPLVATSSGTPYYPRTEFDYDDWGNRIATRTGIAQHLDGSLDFSTVRESKDSYNSQGQLISIARSSELIERRFYNEDGKIDYRLHPDGVVEAFEWSDDPLDPGFSRTAFYNSMLDYENGTVADFNQSTTDALGNVQQSYGIGTASRSYDEQGRLVELSNDAGTIHYQYSASGRLIATWTNNQEDQVVQNRVRYDYDSAGRLETVTLTEKFGVAVNPPETYHYSYNAFGQISQLIHPDGVIEHHEYDSMGRTIKLAYLVGDATPNTIQDNSIVAMFEYSLNAAGNRSEATESFWDASSNTIIESRHWLADYDQVNRLIRYEVSDVNSHSVTTYEYDPAHNRTRTSVDLDADDQIDASTHYRFDAADRLLEEVTSSQDIGLLKREYQYRLGSSNPFSIIERNLATDEVLSTTNYEYDLYGYLTLEEQHQFGDFESIRRVETTYDPNGKLIYQHEIRTQDSDIVFDQAINFIVDELSPSGYSQLFETRDASSHETMSAIASGLRVLSESNSLGASSTLITDAMGSVRGVRNLESGAVAISSYSAFGETQETANASSLHGYAGELHDRESDTIYLRKRTYTPSTGRFLQADSFAGVATQPASLNRYIYAANSPFHYADPSGNLFVLIDGTWNHDSAPHLEPGEDFTNVYYLREAFALKNPPAQYVYERGVGNPVDNEFVMPFFGGAFGLGLSEITNRAVARSKDRLTTQPSSLSITGFSRGAVSALQFAHAIEREVPNVDIEFMGLFDPVASVGFPGNGINFGFNLELSRRTRSAFTLVSYQEDRGYFPGTNLHSSRVKQFVTWGVHSDVGGGYATSPTAIIKDALYMMRSELELHGINLAPVGTRCFSCGPKQTHYPHSIVTYIKHGGQTYGEIARPMVEYPMVGELGLAFFYDEMDFRRVGVSQAEALFTRAMWIPARAIQINTIGSLINLTPGIGGIASTAYRAWNLAALYASHIQYYINRL